MKPEIEREENNQPNRRRVLETAAGAMALGLSAVGGSVASAAEPAGSAKRITKGRIKQSIVHWCFEKYWDVPTFIKITKQLGCTSIELIDPKYFPLLKEAGLECAIATIDMSPEPPFVKGFNNPKYRDKVFKATRDAIDACAEYGFMTSARLTASRASSRSSATPRRRKSPSAWRCSTPATARTR